MLPPLQPLIVAIVATYQRPRYLERMLHSLSAARRAISVVVVDNADDPETAAVTAAPFEFLQVQRVVPGVNLGCGGGLEYGERAAMECHPGVTHFWIMDDDIEVASDALDTMLAAMEKEGAWVACPSVLNRNGRLSWFPGLLDHRAFQIVKKRCLLEDYLSEAGNAAIGFSWAPGVSLLVKREALEQTGLHRGDFWIRGEDIEFSLRLTYHGKGIYVPTAVVRHYPPDTGLEVERGKDYFMLRNHAYIALHLAHGRRIICKLPGAVWRFLRNFGWRSWPEMLRAVWNGAAGKLGPSAPPRRQTSSEKTP